MTLEEALEIVKTLQLNNEQEELALLDLLMLLEEMEEPTDPPDPPDPPIPTKVGIWIGYDEIVALPMEGAAWENVLKAANTNPTTGNLLHQDNQDDTRTYAEALLYARTGEINYLHDVVDMLEWLMTTDLTPSKVNILGAARNIGPYVIAADIINLRSIDPALDNVFREWLTAFRDIVFTAGNDFSIRTGQETRPNNIGLHCGAARVAIALYLGDDIDLARAAQVFRGWLGDREAYAGFKYAELHWQADPSNPVGINPAGAMLMIDGELQNVDGVLPDDQRRDDGKVLKYPFPKVNYSWEALQGVVVTAEMLSRVPEYASVWQWEDEAIYRAFEWLFDVCDYPPAGDDQWITWIINRAYESDFDTAVGVSPGKGMGFTDWTHGGTN